MAPPPSPVPVPKRPSFLSTIICSDLSSRMITHVKIFKAKHALLQGTRSHFPWLFAGHGSDAHTVHRLGHPLPFSAQTGGGGGEKWWPVRHRSMLEYRSASVRAAAFLAQSREKVDELAGEEGLSHSPLPPFQRTENLSSAPQSLVKRSRRSICSP